MIQVIQSSTTFPNTPETDKMTQVWCTVEYCNYSRDEILNTTIRSDYLTYTAYIQATDPFEARNLIMNMDEKEVEQKYHKKPIQNNSRGVAQVQPKGNAFPMDPL